MPLLQQDNGRGGGSRENRRSFAEFLGFDASQLTEPAAAPRASRSNESEEWHWDTPASPEAAPTPRSLVPSACFPPRHPTAFTSYSERARPGSWAEEPSSQGITDLVASLKALTLPPKNISHTPGRSCDSLHTSVTTSYHATVESHWSLEQNQTVNRKKELLPRRSSFCGAVGGGEEAALVWSGPLPARALDGGGYSPKVFLGGLPWDISEHTLMQALRNYHPVRVEWPGRTGTVPDGPRGFAYVTFESERCVHALLAASRRNGNKWHYRISSRTCKSKEAEVIPWSIHDSSWVRGGSARLEPTRTVFVGALHGMLSAHALATIMNDLFAGVVYAGLDTDKNKYPIGSGRVTFNNVRSYVRAISAGYVEIRTDKFTKKVQVDPYLEDSMCSLCNVHQGPYFCREPSCFRYFCRSCWAWQHPTDNHKPLMRSFKTNQPVTATIGNGNGNGNNGNMHCNNGNGQRQSPHSDHSSISGGFGAPNDLTPSPSTSAASGSSEPATEEVGEWPLH
ncbi:cytoplasmic polyadenylation element-binding protein 1 isoform X1 [Colias croceus]|uniref:cytoplasmic polyadenylation element-binding protein 1 isoform X1 n=1 Tax=Colias crocea TaxID=72248 RepID=UPI001E27BF5F|nr:cytoplasmic polyadenylation element-binding protein 1 isoform X1 [Colias croceus]